MNLILPKSNIMLTSVSEVSQICVPLRKYGITAFSHTRVYDDSSFIDISDNAEMIECFYYKTDIYKYYEPDVNPAQLNTEFFLCSSLQDNKAVQVCREDLNIDNVIVLSEKVDDAYHLWNFGTTRGNDQIVNFYINNLDILKSFVLYFKDKARKIIKNFEKEKIIRENIGNSFMNKIKNKDCAHMNTIFSNLKRYHLGGKFHDSYLTPTEFQILCFSMVGKSSEEISIILGSKKRTIEKHMENIKLKFSCSNKSSIVKKVFQETYLEKSIDFFIENFEKGAK